MLILGVLLSVPRLISASRCFDHEIKQVWDRLETVCANARIPNAAWEKKKERVVCSGTTIKDDKSAFSPL